MQRTDLPLHLQKMLEETPYVTIATASGDGTPWITPVVGVFDGQLVLYWASGPGSRHSRNIAAQPKVAVVVYDSHAPLGHGSGLYMYMFARELSGRREIHIARRLYADRFGEDGTHEPFIGQCPRRLYRAVPAHMWTNDSGTIDGHFIDIREPL